MILNGHGLNMDLLAGEGGDGWNEAWCYPHLHKHLLPEIKPYDTVLDLGAGVGRSSFPFALYGASIFMVDTNTDFLIRANELFSNAGVANKIVYSCPISIDHFLQTTNDKYNFVLLVDTLTHINKQEGLEIIRRAIDVCRGFLFVSVPSIDSWSLYERMMDNFGHPEPFTYNIVCGCSGQEQIEPFSYYVPGEIESIVIQKGGRIITAESYLNQFGTRAWIVIAKF